MLRKVYQLIGVEGGDSRGNSMSLEIPQEHSDEEAQAMPAGKRPPGTQINVAPPYPVLKPNTYHLQ